MKLAERGDHRLRLLDWVIARIDWIDGQLG